MEKRVEEFWDNCHNKRILASLSGSSYDDTIDFLKVRHLIKPGIRVLEVGVGIGNAIKGLHTSGALVSCVDISKPALDAVRNYCEFAYRVDELAELPSDYFDVVICVNVVQHIPTNDLKTEFTQILRSLKSTGVFAVEFVSNDKIEDMGDNPNIDMIKNGGCCRSPEFLERLIEELGGTCELVFTKDVDINMVKGQHVFHIRKKNA